LPLIALIGTHIYTLGSTPLDKGSARRRDLYLITHTTHKRRTCVPRLYSNPQSQQASLRPRGHWDRLLFDGEMYWNLFQLLLQA